MNRTHLCFFAVLAATVFPSCLFGQSDQGTITGTVEDIRHAAIPHAQLTLANPDNGLTLHEAADGNGVFVFTPVKVGRYNLTATAAGFETATQTGVQVDVNQRTGVNFSLKVGSVSQSIDVTAASEKVQAEEASTGQVYDAAVIQDTPLNGRNYVYIAQLSAGIAPPNAGARGANKGDFSANGQRVEQNNFILDGVDNNSNLVDFLNASSYVVKPPPDALQEFRVQTGNYTAELGHSAGAVINATIKSGTNDIHGSLWEYFRNDALDARDFFAAQTPVYRQNQFGGTLGGPILKNRLFLFADGEENRVIFGETGTYTVPTAKMRTGDFSELLTPGLNNLTVPRLLYEPGSAGTVPLTCGGQLNVICPSQISPVAERVLNLYPLPNLGQPGQTYSNYLFQGNASDFTSQWDARSDWNISSKDQFFARFSYFNQPQFFPQPLGAADGGAFNQDGNIDVAGHNLALSETHLFSSSAINEFRFGYNQLHAAFQPPGSGSDISSQLGLGGIPYSPGLGGLPYFSISSLSASGDPKYDPANENEHVLQWLDNFTKIVGRHTLKAGFSLQRIEFSTLQPQQARGAYTFNGSFTNNPSKSGSSGFGAADLLLDQIYTSTINNVQTTDDRRWYRAAYVQDDWKVTPRLTLNLGLRWEYSQPIDEINGHQANFIPDYANGAGVYLLPASSKNIPLPAPFLTSLQTDNIAVQYTNNSLLVTPDWKNVAPRFGVAYRMGDRTVIRGGFGIFYGGLESIGYGPNLGQNAPFVIFSTFPSGSCKVNACPSNGQTLETGFSNVIAAGFNNFASLPTLHGYQTNSQTPYSEQWNFSIERALPLGATATASYVGSASHHLPLDPEINQVGITLAPGQSLQSSLPFTAFGTGGRLIDWAGAANYNSLQSKLERRYANGLFFLLNWTWSHAFDDAFPPLGGSGDTYTSIRNWRQLGYNYDYGDSYQDVRHRVTLNAQYQLPFARQSRGLVKAVGGGWQSSVVYRWQTGSPELILASNNPVGTGNVAYAVPIASPFATGTIGANNTGGACASVIRTVQAWFNPCSFNNPPVATGPDSIASYGPKGRTMVYGPGYYRFDVSLFKSFPVFSERHSLQFRADAFNLTNTHAFGQPGYTIGSGLGKITTERFGGQGPAAENPDARVIQLALKFRF
jgi:hypothetical protein